MSTHSINAPFSSASISPAPSHHAGTSQAFQAVASIAITVLITAAGFLVIDIQSSPMSHPAAIVQAPTAVQRARKPVSQPATMEIVAEPASGVPAALFEGTGDGSAGGWTAR